MHRYGIVQGCRVFWWCWTLVLLWIFPPTNRPWIQSISLFDWNRQTTDAATVLTNLGTSLVLDKRNGWMVGQDYVSINRSKFTSAKCYPNFGFSETVNSGEFLNIEQHFWQLSFYRSFLRPIQIRNQDWMYRRVQIWFRFAGMEFRS